MLIQLLVTNYPLLHSYPLQKHFLFSEWFVKICLVLILMFITIISVEKSVMLCTKKHTIQIKLVVFLSHNKMIKIIIYICDSRLHMYFYCYYSSCPSSFFAIYITRKVLRCRISEELNLASHDIPLTDRLLIKLDWMINSL